MFGPAAVQDTIHPAPPRAYACSLLEDEAVLIAQLLSGSPQATALSVRLFGSVTPPSGWLRSLGLDQGRRTRVPDVVFAQPAQLRATFLLSLSPAARIRLHDDVQRLRTV